MLNFFRRIRKSFLDSSQARKYILYAIGEIALVVIGILIALQINNWNEWRKDRVREQNVLFDLADNLERNISLVQDAISIIEEINYSSEIGINVIEKRLPYSDTLDYHFDQMTRSGSYIIELNKDGYESFKNIGFEILSSKKLKNEILSLFEVSYKKYEKTVEVTNAIWGNNPFWWKEYFMNNLDSGMIPIEYAKLYEDNAVLSIVKTLLSQRITLIARLKMVLAESQRVLQLVEEELHK